MSILTPAVEQEDDVFAAFASGQALADEFVRSEELPGGHHALSSHGVTFALRSEEVVVFDARPHADGCPCISRVVAHMGRAGVHVHEVFGDDEVECFVHPAFVELEARLRGAL
jgi:hypothetical protein